MLNSVEVKHYRSADVESVLLFYANTTYRNTSSVDAKDEIVIAYHSNEIVGLYRLCHEADICVLRGFYVLEPYRGKGIGSLMLQKLNEVAKSKFVYLTCTKPRNSFYAKTGFNIALNDVPSILQERLRNYNNPEMNILLRLAENED